MISGIINLKKEAGMTSHDAVFKIRKILKEKKVGHGGTLDPDVTGVLPIALGKATRLIEYMQESAKEYEGEVVLGFSTTTEDASGQVVERSSLPEHLTEGLIEQVMLGFLGQIKQIPPLYSAVKVNGRKLYDYARAGEKVERPERQVTIHNFIRTGPLEFTEDLARFSFRVTCSKGTYVRTLAVDLGAKLGVASHLATLKRTAAAGLTFQESLSLSEIASMVEEGDFSFILPIETAIKQLPRLDVAEEMKQAIVYGQFLSLNCKEDRLAAFYDGNLLAILERRDETFHKPRKVFI